MEKYKVTYQGIELEIERLPNGKFKKPSLSRFTKQGLACTWLDDGRIPHDGQICGTSPSHSVAEGWDRPWRHDAEHAERIYQAKLAGNEKARRHGRFPANLLVSDDVVDDGKVTKSPSGFRSSGGYQDAYVGGELTDPIRNYQTSGGDSGGFSRYFSLDKWWQAKLSELWASLSWHRKLRLRIRELLARLGERLMRRFGQPKPDYFQPEAPPSPFDSKLSALPESVQRTFPFLVVPKAGKKEKNLGCEGTFTKLGPQPKRAGGMQARHDGSLDGHIVYSRNAHPTVKPLKLMSYLITLGSRPNDLVLDPFAGTCTTGMAAKMLGRNYLMVEIDEQWCRIGRRRVEAVQERLL